MPTKPMSRLTQSDLLRLASFMGLKQVMMEDEEGMTVAEMRLWLSTIDGVDDARRELFSVPGPSRKKQKREPMPEEHTPPDEQDAPDAPAAPAAPAVERTEVDEINDMIDEMWRRHTARQVLRIT